LATVHERHRQDRTDRQRTDSIGRTVLQTVAQKRKKHGKSVRNVFRPLLLRCGLLLQAEWRGLSVAIVSPATTAESIEMLFGM